MDLFCATLPGLEQVLYQELSDLGVERAKITPGGVSFTSDLQGMYRANLWLRTASQVSIRLGTFQAFNWKQLIKNTQKIPWSTWLNRDCALTVQATCRKSKLYHSTGVEERVLEGISRAMGGNCATSDDPDTRVSVAVRIERDRCTISLNSSGVPLHKRGYRQQVGKAPLREHLAAGALILSGWSSRASILKNGFSGFHDPMCGSGVFPIEAALIAKNVAPGLLRSFSFQKFSNFDEGFWAQCLEQAHLAATPHCEPYLCGTDRNAGAITMAQDNAQRAGVLEEIEFSQSSVSAVRAQSERGLVCCNPPYGARLSKNKDVRNLYARLGQVHQEHFPLWDLSLVTNTRNLASSTKLRFGSVSAPLPHGGLRVQLYRHKPPAR